MLAQMTHQSDKFLFVDVTAEKRTNTRRVKSHVSHQTIRRKRQQVTAGRKQHLLEAINGVESDTEDTRSSQSADKESASPEAHENTEIGSAIQLVKSSAIIDFDVGGQSRRRLFESKSELESRIWNSYRDWLGSHMQTNSHTISRATESTLPVRQLMLPSSSLNRSQKISGLASPTSSASTVLWSPAVVRNVDLPAQFAHASRAVQIVQSFIQSSYHNRWRSIWEGKHWLDVTAHEMGTWTECFYLTVDYLNEGKLEEAFSILNAALSSAAEFLRTDHTVLIMAVLIIMRCCQVARDERLRKIVQYHLFHLATATLGDSHAISLVLKELLAAGDSMLFLDGLLWDVALDAITRCFGKDHFVPVSLHFGEVYRMQHCNQYDGALAVIDKVEAIWAANFKSSSPLLQVLSFEKAKLRRLKRETTDMDLHQSWRSSLAYVEQVRTKFQTGLMSSLPGVGVQLRPEDNALLQRLSDRLLAGGQHAFLVALHAHLHDIFDATNPDDPLAPSDRDSASCVTVVAKIMLRSIRSGLR